MSELKAFYMPRYAGAFTTHEVYLKSEADRYIAYLKYKRCEKILENLSLGYNIECMKKYPTRGFFFEKWSRVFMRLAEHYKEIAK